MGLYLLKSENQKKKGNGLETSACSCKQRPAHVGRLVISPTPVVVVLVLVVDRF